MIEAPTCTLGPSRPVDAPMSRPVSVSTILPTAMRSETSFLRSSGSMSLRAAIACGMPLP
jgi:hypothetical protein